MPQVLPHKDDFDIGALQAAMDAQRMARALTWRSAADEIWALSAELNAQRSDHPISPSTITGMAKRGNTTCQHALFFLRWLARAPENFLPSSTVDVRHAALPAAGPDRRLRWDLTKLHGALDEQRQARGLTWVQTGRELHCAANQLTGLRTAAYATNMILAMRITQWLHRPARDFVYAAEW